MSQVPQEASRRKPPDRTPVLAAYADGTSAIRRAGLLVRDWNAPTPCGEWTTKDLVGHLLAIVRYYHRLLDASSGGVPLVGLPRGPDLAEMNLRDLARLGDLDGTERLDMFSDLAGSYLRRLRHADWDQTLGRWSGLGDLSVGEHTGIAIGEWHVHAWDLARACGNDHRPEDAFTVKDGQRVVMRATGPGDPWTAVLRGYERDPDWSISDLTS